jgi:hypothetical protein
MDVDTEHVSSSLSNVASPTRVPGGYPNLGRDSVFPHFSQFIIQWQRIRGRCLVFSILRCNTNVLNWKANDTCTYGPCCELMKQQVVVTHKLRFLHWWTVGLQIQLMSKSCIHKYCQTKLLLLLLYIYNMHKFVY